MELVWALVVGVLFAGGIFLLLRRNPVRVILGLGLLGHGANLLIFVAGGLTRGRPPIVAEGETVLAPPYADPLPQALILTAIVIGFAVVAFALALFHRTYATLGGEAMDMDRLEGADV
jgi:multicomponent Na+:H+ antiporter subunit C